MKKGKNCKKKIRGVGAESLPQVVAIILICFSQIVLLVDIVVLTWLLCICPCHSYCSTSIWAVLVLQMMYMKYHWLNITSWFDIVRSEVTLVLLDLKLPGYHLLWSCPGFICFEVAQVSLIWKWSWYHLVWSCPGITCFEMARVSLALRWP